MLHSFAKEDGAAQSFWTGAAVSSCLFIAQLRAASCSHWRIVRVGGPQTENWGFVHRLCQFLVSPVYRLYDAPGCISLKLLCRDHSRGRHAESGMKACSAEGICFCEEKGTNACEKGC